ncbi:MAG: c-type cytochrome [Gemmatimonadaceae bacterium]|nr:c-type cytochrome [Chitinophagaceae bacterium]
MKKFFKWSGIVLLMLILSLFLAVFLRQDIKFDAPYPNVVASTDSAVIARGKSLVFGPAHCANCHSSPEMEKDVLNGTDVPLSGGRVFDLPIGLLYAKNLTPDATGIGSMTDGEIARSLRFGVSRDGNALFDFMPFHNTSDEDLSAIISYLRSQPSFSRAIPENQMNLLGRFVKAFLLKPVGPDGPVAVSVTRDTTAEYGKYLANSVANCKGCHTNRDLMTGAYTGEDYAGGLKFDMPSDSGTFSLTTPNLTPDKTGRLFGWSQQQFIDRFRKGPLVPGSHMPWGPFSRMSDDELKAIYKFLKTVKPVSNPVKIGLVKEG